MTLDKVIEILHNIRLQYPPYPPTDEGIAITQSIRAIQALKSYRNHQLKGFWLPLPGETLHDNP